MKKNTQEAFIIFVIVLAAYGYFSWGLDWNVNSRLALVKSIVEEGRFEIDSYVSNDLATNDKALLDGRYYSDKAIGSSILGVIVYYPLYWLSEISRIQISTNVFNNVLTFVVISLPTALLAPFSYILAKQITKNPVKALIVSLGISLGTPLFKYSTAYYGHSLAATSYFFAFIIWFNAKQKQRISWQLAFLSSFLLGYMVITEYPTAVLLGILAPYILYVLHKTGQLFDWKIYGAMALGIIIPLAILLYYNNNVFGSPFSTGYSHEESSAYKAAHQESVMGIGVPDVFVFWYQTFQPAFGIFWQSPILFFAMPGWILMVMSRKYRAEAIFCLSAIFLYILMFSGYYMWWGGLSFTPRHLIPILPLFALPLAFVPEIFWAPLALGSLVSIFQNFILTASNFEGLGILLNEYYRPLWKKHGILQPRGMLVYDVSLPNVIDGEIMNNRGMDIFKLPGKSSLVPFFLVEAVFLFAYIKQLYKPGSE